MLRVLISSFDEVSRQVFKNFISFAEVSLTASETGTNSDFERLRYGH